MNSVVLLRHYFKLPRQPHRLRCTEHEHNTANWVCECTIRLWRDLPACCTMSVPLSTSAPLVPLSESSAHVLSAWPFDRIDGSRMVSTKPVYRSSWRNCHHSVHVSYGCGDPLSYKHIECCAKVHRCSSVESQVSAPNSPSSVGQPSVTFRRFSCFVFVVLNLAFALHAYTLLMT